MSGVNMNDEDIVCAANLADLGSSNNVGQENPESEESIGGSTAVPEEEGAARKTGSSEGNEYAAEKLIVALQDPKKN